MPQTQVLILGLDALEPALIQRWMADLPNIKALIKQGCWGQLRSAPNMNSAPAWASFATGVQPGKHGIYYFTEIPRGTYCRRLINARARRAPAFWSYLSQQSIRVGIVNVPISFPAEPVQGFVIAGMDAPSTQAEGFCFPPDIFSQVVEKNRIDYCIEPRIHGMMRRQNYEAAMGTILNALKARLQLVIGLTELISVDVLVVVFTAADVAQHFFWGFMDPQHPHYHQKDIPHKARNFIYAVYRRLDQAVGELVATFDPELIILLSDHGAGFNQRGGDFLFPWLQRLGLLRCTSGLWRKIWTRLHKTDCPAGLQPWPLLRDVDWGKTKVYCVGTDDLFINLRGREPLGTVSPAEKSLLEEKLLYLLHHTVDPRTHLPVVEYADTAERIYWGPYTDLAPDILIRWSTRHILNGLLTPGYEPVLAGDKLPLLSGGHRLYGVLIITGSKICPNNIPLKADITDVAPTLLHWLGLPIPDHYDGRVLTEVFEPEWLENNPVKKIRHTEITQGTERDLESDEARLVEERLRDLGYID